MTAASPRSRSRRTRARRAALVTSAAVAFASSASVAGAQQPTLQFDRECYTDGQEMRFSGSGYTPGGPVDLFFAAGLEPRALYRTHADAAGALNDFAIVRDAEEFLPEHSRRALIFVTANDRTRIDGDQQPPESQFGFARFSFTDWQGFSPRRYAPGSHVTVEAFGWAFAMGETVWLQFHKGTRVVSSVEVGELLPPCGDRRATVKVPRKLKPGRYRIVLSTERVALSERYTWRRGQVKPARGVRAATAASRGMVRAGRTAAAHDVRVRSRRD